MKTKNKIVIFSIFIIPVVLIAIIFIIASNKNNSRITMHENYIEFDALTYDKVIYEDIKEINYLENWNLKGNKNGVGMSNHNYFSGDAYIENIGECRAYIYYKKDYYVMINAETSIIFNLNSKQETEEIYEALLKEIEKEKNYEKQ